MYARASTLTLQQGKTDEAFRIFSDSVIPAAKKQQGFKGSLWLKDTNANKVIGITLWETEANLKASETSGYYQEQIAKFATVMAGSSTREVYEAVVNM
jgi:heme-degrading monooxygenase HmoA